MIGWDSLRSYRASGSGDNVTVSDQTCSIQHSQRSEEDSELQLLSDVAR